MPVTESAPATATVLRSICPPLTVRLESFLVPPTAPCRFTAPPPASSVSDSVPAVFAFTVEVKVIVPSVSSSSESLSIVTPMCRSTGPVNLMLPSALL